MLPFRFLPNGCLVGRTVLLACAYLAATLSADSAPAQDLSGVLGAALSQREARRVADNLYMASGFGNTFLVTTANGNVVVDTSMRQFAERHKKLLKKASDQPVRYVLLTHGHGDHIGGAALWREPGTKVVAQRKFGEFLDYQYRLGELFVRRNAAQFGLNEDDLRARLRAPRLVPDVLFGERYEFELGGTKFELFHTPGETPDHATIWLPQQKAVFCGDNYYASFPNLYTLRGTQPRWALEYVAAIDKILTLEPELLLPSHGDPISGKETIAKTLTRYRDAIRYVHDATVRGLNEGQDVYTLMREIRLPPELDVGDSYGKVSWSVRGIYEGYVGWFDGNPASMYSDSPAATNVDLVRIAGADRVAQEAKSFSEQGELLRALRLADAVLATDPKHRAALDVRLRALQGLLAQSRNSNESGWLRDGIRKTEAALREVAPARAE